MPEDPMARLHATLAVSPKLRDVLVQASLQQYLAGRRKPRRTTFSNLALPSYLRRAALRLRDLGLFVAERASRNGRIRYRLDEELIGVLPDWQEENGLLRLDAQLTAVVRDVEGA